MFEDAPMCYINSCLNFEHGYCLADMDNITPNTPQCLKYVECSDYTLESQND